MSTTDASSVSLQCSQCSSTLLQPITLPCGNTFCKRCTPSLHTRNLISYPGTPSRLQGFICSFAGCRKDHAIADCNVDVVLNKVTDFIRTQTEKHEKSQQAVLGMVLESKDEIGIKIPTSSSEISSSPLISVYEKLGSLDSALQDEWKTAIKSELECQICSGIFLDPVTTPCGHTFCRKCLRPALNYSTDCPACRQTLGLQPSLTTEQAPSNILIGRLVSGLFSEAIAERQENEKAETLSKMEPLFVCALSFPRTPTYLHIFEPRYRLMIRRVLEDQSYTFGMVLPNPDVERQGGLNQAPFLPYGTLLKITNVQMLPNGRSTIETTGISRFLVKEHDVLDGYHIGKIERFDDISISEEETRENDELTVLHDRDSSPKETINQLADLFESGTLQHEYLRRFSTQHLMDIGKLFIEEIEQTGEPRLTSRLMNAYGPCPSDPAIFPWWFANVIPSSEPMKYNMLLTDSVRERMKMCAMFVAELETKRRAPSNCSLQ